MEQKTSSVESTKLAIKFAIPTFLEGMLAQMENSYFIFFMSSICLMSTAAVAKVTGIGSTLIAISSLFSGIIMQSITFKKGKYRPWLIIAAVGILIGRAMQFTKINASENVLVTWFIVGYLLMNFAYAFTCTAEQSLMTSAAPDGSTRVKMSSWRTVGSNVMKLIFGAVALPFIQSFASEVAGYSVMGIITGVLAAIGGFFLFFTTKPSDDVQVVAGDKSKDNTKVNIIEMLKYTVINKDAILFYLAMWFKVASSLLIAFSISFYFQYYVGNMAMMTIYLTSSSFVKIVGSFVTPYIAKLFKGVRNTYGGALIGYCVLFVVCFLLKGNPAVVAVILSINEFFWGVYQSAELPLYMGVIDETEYKSGKDLTAFMMSVWTFGIKVGIIIANFCLTQGMLTIGFEAAAVTEEAVSKLPIICLLGPALLAALAAVFTFLIPLTDDKIAEYRAANAAKKAEMAQGN